jgi:hypothetical protein
MSISLTDQLTEARRELALRKKLYPGFVARGKLTQGQADYALAAQEAICATLARLVEGEAQPSLFGMNQSPWALPPGKDH